MHRTRSGKKLVLTGRDIEIFRQLSRYRYLTSTYLHAFVGGKSETRFKERLGDLFHEGYIGRPPQQWQLADARCRPAVYELGERARSTLTEYGEMVDARRDFLSAAVHRQFMHSLLVCACLASVELATTHTSNLRFIPWAEILARAPAATRNCTLPFRIPTPNSTAVIPDGIFGIEYQMDARKSYRFFAVEIDRGTMPVTRSSDAQTSCLAKFAAYREIIERQIHRSHLGTPNLLVLTITTSEARVSEMMKRVEQNTVASAVFLFKSIGTGAEMMRAPRPDFLLAPWKRGQLPALTISSREG